MTKTVKTTSDKEKLTLNDDDKKLIKGVAGGLGVAVAIPAFLVRTGFVTAGIVLATSTPIVGLMALGGAVAAYSTYSIISRSVRGAKAFKKINKALDGQPVEKNKKFDQAESGLSRTFKLAKNVAVTATGVALLTQVGGALAVTLAVPALALGGLYSLSSGFNLVSYGIKKIKGEKIPTRREVWEKQFAAELAKSEPAAKTPTPKKAEFEKACSKTITVANQNQPKAEAPKAAPKKAATKKAAPKK